MIGGGRWWSVICASLHPHFWRWRSLTPFVCYGGPLSYVLINAIGRSVSCCGSPGLEDGSAGVMSLWGTVHQFLADVLTLILL